MKKKIILPLFIILIVILLIIFYFKGVEFEQRMGSNSADKAVQVNSEKDEEEINGELGQNLGINENEDTIDNIDEEDIQRDLSLMEGELDTFDDLDRFEEDLDL